MVLRTQADAARWNDAKGPDGIQNTAQTPSNDDKLVNDDKGVPRSAAWWEGLVRDDVRNLEMMRGLYDIFGRAI